MEDQTLQALRYGRMPQANELHASGKQQEHVGESLPVHEAIAYLENHGEPMGDAHARQRGLPIGSGTVEAPCKSLVALRMKRPGARWKHPSCQHILDLRTLVLSDRWSRAMPLVLAWSAIVNTLPCRSAYLPGVPNLAGILRPPHPE
jgi:hypothetical protein